MDIMYRIRIYNYSNQMFNSPMFLLNILFIAYYVYAGDVFHRLWQNHCSCKKLEGFKKTWNFRYVILLIPVLCIFNIVNLSYGKQIFKFISNKALQRKIILAGFAITFVFDYAIIDLFHTMKKKECPCTREPRETLLHATYVKLFTNVLFLINLVQYGI